MGDVEGFTCILCCKVAYSLMKHLGLILGASYKATSISNDIIETMKRCLLGWKRLYLSRGGRLILIKNTLSNLPIYYFSVFPIRVGVAKKLEKPLRDFYRVELVMSLGSI